MIPRILSIAGPLWVYVSLGILAYGLWQERLKFDWLALIPAFAGLAASAFFLAPIHRLFFDEDFYISIANNLEALILLIPRPSGECVDQERCKADP